MLKDVDVKQITRSIVKSIPYVGAGIDELIFGTLDKKTDQKHINGLFEALEVLKCTESINYQINKSINEKVSCIITENKISLALLYELAGLLKEYRNKIIKYAQELISDEQEYNKGLFYVQPRCVNEHEDNISLHRYAATWLESSDNLTLAVLGDFGSGKTTFARKLTRIIAEAYLERPTENYFPVKIELRDFPYANGIEDIVQRSLAKKGIEPKDYHPLESTGRILYILDGFDEMSVKVKRALILNNSIELGRLAFNKNKIIITSRTHFFGSREDERIVLRISRTTHNTGLLLNNKSDAVDIVYLAGFTEDDIQSYLQYYFKEQWQESYQLLGSVYNLYELSDRPILLNLIVQILPTIHKNKIKNITISQLYRTIVDKWIIREQWRNVHPDEIILVMEEFALHLFVNGCEYLTAEELRNIIYRRLLQRIEYEGIPAEDLEGIIRTASFVRRDGNDNYLFMHKSFMEYFLSRRFISELRQNILSPNSFGSNYLTDGIIIFLNDMMSNNKIILNVIELLRGKTKVDVNFIIGNILSLMSFRNEMMTDLDLSNLYIKGAIIKDTDMNGSNFTNSKILQCKFSDVFFEEANFTNALLENVSFYKVSLEGSEWKRANFINSILREVNVMNVKNPEESNWSGNDSYEIKVKEYLTLKHTWANPYYKDPLY